MKHLTVIPPKRGCDRHGSGAYLAPRGGRKHKGIDLSCVEGSFVQAVCAGKVTKIGYPYSPSDPEKGHLRYIEIKDSLGYKARYFYIDPAVWVSTLIREGMVIGVAQDLTTIYKGITPHIHFEVKDPDGDFIDPDEYLKMV